MVEAVRSWQEFVLRRHIVKGPTDLITEDWTTPPNRRSHSDRQRSLKRRANEHLKKYVTTKDWFYLAPSKQENNNQKKKEREREREREREEILKKRKKKEERTKKRKLLALKSLKIQFQATLLGFNISMHWHIELDLIRQFHVKLAVTSTQCFHIVSTWERCNWRSTPQFLRLRVRISLAFTNSGHLAR